MAYQEWVDIVFALLFGLSICFNMYSCRKRGIRERYILLVLIYLTVSLLRTPP